MALSPAVVPGASETKTCRGKTIVFAASGEGLGSYASRGEERMYVQGMRSGRQDGEGGGLGVASSHSRRSGQYKPFWV